MCIAFASQRPRRTARSGVLGTPGRSSRRDWSSPCCRSRIPSAPVAEGPAGRRSGHLHGALRASPEEPRPPCGEMLPACTSQTPLPSRTVRGSSGVERQSVLRYLNARSRASRGRSVASSVPAWSYCSRSGVHAFPDDLRRFLDYVEGDRLAPLYHLEAMTGLRRGEVLGLRWSDLDLHARTLKVEQTLVVVEGRAVFSTPKTDVGRRTVALDPRTVETLRAHRAAQGRERLAAGSVWQDLGFVFTRPDGRPLPRTGSTSGSRRS